MRLSARRPRTRRQDRQGEAGEGDYEAARRQGGYCTADVFLVAALSAGVRFVAVFLTLRFRAWWWRASADDPAQAGMRKPERPSGPLTSAVVDCRSMICGNRPRYSCGLAIVTPRCVDDWNAQRRIVVQVIPREDIRRESVGFGRGIGLLALSPRTSS
jgi:hypothetical protein